MCVPSIKLEIDKEIAFGDTGTLCDDKDGIFRFPSCLIHDSSCIKEEVKDEITVEEGGVHCEIEKEARHIASVSMQSVTGPLKWTWMRT